MNRWLARLDEFERVAAANSGRSANPVQIVQNAQNSFSAGTSEQIEQIERLPAPAGSEVFEERAAVIEDGTRVSRQWAEGFATLSLLPAPPTITSGRWRALVDAAGRFLDRWGLQAAARGWEAADIFGCHPSAPAARYDLQGLVWVLGAGEVVAMTEATATVRQPSGSCLTFRRIPRPSSERIAMVWELDASD